MAALKHSKSKYKKQMVTENFQITPNCYNLLGSDSNDDDDDDDDTPAKTDRLSKSAISYVRNDKKKNHKKNSVKNIVHKVLILGDSHASGCASEVKQQLNNKYEVFGFINPGSGMKDIIGSAKMKISQLTRVDIVVLWGGANDVARNNSMVSVKYILDLMISSFQTHAIPFSVPHRHDPINHVCVNREVKFFSRSL